MGQQQHDDENMLLAEIERLRAALKAIQHRSTDMWAETYARDALLGAKGEH